MKYRRGISCLLCHAMTALILIFPCFPLRHAVAQFSGAGNVAGSDSPADSGIHETTAPVDRFPTAMDGDETRRAFSIFDLYDVDGDGFIGADGKNMALLPLTVKSRTGHSGKSGHSDLAQEREFREKAEKFLEKIPLLKKAVDFASSQKKRDGFSFGFVGSEKQNADIFKREFEGKFKNWGMGRRTYREIEGTIAPAPESDKEKSLGVSYKLSW